MMYKDPAEPNGSLRKEVRSYELILALRRRFLWVLGVCLLSFVATYWFSAGYFIYRSRVIIDVSPAPVFLSNQERNNQSIEIFRSSEYVMRILQFVHSNRMADHLIQKFDLYKYYKINPSSKYGYNHLCLILNHKIEVKKSPFENVIITVSDGNRDFAARMADEIASYTDVLAREYFSSVLGGKLAYYRAIIQELDANFLRKTDTLNATLATIREMKHKASGDEALENKLTDAESALLSQSAQMSDIIDRLTEIKKSQQWILSLMNNQEVKFISVMQKAIPDPSNLLLPRLLLCLGAAFAASWVSILFIFFAKTYRQYFNLLFSR
jgi:hypothetical protein